MRPPLTWTQRSGRSGGRSHYRLERFRSHYGLPTGRPSLTSWLKFSIDWHERKGKMREIVKLKKNNKNHTFKFSIHNLKGEILFCLMKLPEIWFLPPGRFSMSDACWHKSFHPHPRLWLRLRGRQKEHFCNSAATIPFKRYKTDFYQIIFANNNHFFSPSRSTSIGQLRTK